jgi:hypothetical protein
LATLNLTLFLSFQCCNGSYCWLPWQPTLSYISHIFGSTHSLLLTLSFCSQPYASIYRHSWCCSTCSLVNNGGHRLQLIQQWWLPIVNGWCQPFAAHAMATTQQSPPLSFMWAIVFLLLQHMLAFCSSSKLTILRASLAKFPGTCQTF